MNKRMNTEYTCLRRIMNKRMIRMQTKKNITNTKTNGKKTKTKSKTSC